MKKLTLLAILSFTSTAMLASQDNHNEVQLSYAEQEYVPDIIAEYCNTINTLQLNETFLKSYNSEKLLEKMNAFLKECSLSSEKIELIKKLAKKKTSNENRIHELFEDYIERTIWKFSGETELEKSVKKLLNSKKK